MNITLDPRVHPYRHDLAARSLAGRVDAKHFADGAPHRVAVGCASLRGAPDDRAMQTSQLLYGEVFVVYEDRDGWAWGQGAADGYVGYARLEALSADLAAPTHRVLAVRALVFPEPDLKRPPRDALCLTSLVAAVGEDKGFTALTGGGWVPSRHLGPLGATEPDTVVTARRFLEVPYLWGGRTVLGLDCSGLVQLALAAAGVPCPRDSDQQLAVVGAPVPVDEVLRRGDLVFSPGHVGLMADDRHLLHANAFHMKVVEEPLAAVTARLGSRTGRPITGVRRLD